MSRFYILPILGILGIIFVIRTIIAGSVPSPVAAPVVEPAQSPYKKFVAGSGVIEATNGNIAVASPLAGIIKQVFVDVGDAISEGQPLFALDDRDPLAQLGLPRRSLKKPGPPSLILRRSLRSTSPSRTCAPSPRASS